MASTTPPTRTSSSSSMQHEVSVPAGKMEILVTDERLSVRRSSQERLIHYDWLWITPISGWAAPTPNTMQSWHSPRGNVSWCTSSSSLPSLLR